MAVYIRRISDIACHPSNEYLSEPRHLSVFVQDSRIGWATVLGTPKHFTNTPMVLQFQSSVIPVAQKPGPNAHLESDLRGSPLAAVMIHA